MFPYYGSKTNVVKYYPPPKYGKIIEPFCGSARYALKYWDREVIIVDKYEVLIGVWKWLQQCSPADVLKLPRLKYGEKLNRYKFDCPEALALMGFLTGFSAESPRHQVTIKLKQRPNFINFNLHRIAGDLHKIKHWDIRLGSFEEIENEEATWFIDPPYKHLGGDAYVESSKNIDFQYLKEWSLSREGQIIVCEGKSASWLDFQPIAKHRTRRGMQQELMFTNIGNSVMNEQLKIF